MIITPDVRRADPGNDERHKGPFFGPVSSDVVSDGPVHNL